MNAQHRNLLSMITAALLVASIVASSSEATAAPKRRAAAAPLDADDLAIVFLVPDAGAQTSAAAVDLGTVSHAGGGRANATRVTTRVGVRVERKSGATGGNVTLRAWLAAPDARCNIRIDGQPLGVAPRVIDAHATVGTTTPHRIDVEVPVAAHDGSLASPIVWDVTTN